MKKLYSIVLMATALLIGTNAWATTQNDIQNAIDNAAAGATVDITLNSNVELTAPIQIYAKKAVAGKTVNLNLGGFTISNHTDLGQKALIELYKGTLNITNGQIATTANCEAIKVFGAYEDVADWSILNVGAGVTVSSTSTATGDALKANAISILELVPTYYRQIKVEYAGQSLMGLDPEEYKAQYVSGGKVVNPTKYGNCAIAYNAIDYGSIYSAGTTVKSGKVSGVTYSYVAYSTTGVVNMAFGAKVNILAGALVYGDKYGIKINGSIKAAGTNVPSVHIAKDAEVKAAPNTQEATAVYSSGNGAFVIEGYVHGSTGVYVKGGSVSVEDGAKIQSDNTDGTGIASTGKTSGIAAGGNAIAIEGNNAAYTSEGISVQINGGEIIAGEDGYAVQNLNNEAAQSNPNAVTISGGEFEGGAAGCVTIDNTKGNVDVELEGGTFTGNIETLIAATGDENKIIQEVVAQEGGQATVVIGTKEAGDEVEQPVTPQEKQDFVFVNDMSNDIVKLDATTAPIEKTLPAGTTEVKYLSLTGTGANTSTVTVEAGKTLKVGQIVMNANGRLIVEAGAKLIVTGANGIFADDIENLVLETSIANPSIFLLNPAVANNRNPKAKVEFMVKSFYTGSKYIYQRFGLPMMQDGLELIYGEGNPRSRFWAFDYTSNSWTALGYINPNPGQADLDYSKLNEPFEYYQMYNFEGTSTPTKYTLEGRLLGNSEPTMVVLENSWKGFSNSYMGELSLSELLKLIPSTVDKAVYTYNVNATVATWEPVSNLNSADQKLNPMQPFLIRNRYDAANVELDYEHAVYNPTLGIPNPSQAPSRAINNITMAKIAIANEYSQDYVIVAEGEDFSAEFDNGYDAAKFMNDGINMYVSADEKMSIFATDDLSNTYVGLKSVEGGKYTITFANVQGAELTLIDHETGAQVAMVEGATYEFTAAANSTNDYRFEIVEPAKLPTAIENAEAVKSAKGIYTITGQYVGEMNVWNTLPAGIYVVNGEKLVK